MRQSHCLLFTVTVTVTGCYQPDFSGLSCLTKQECGDLDCIAGVCLDAVSGDGSSSSSGHGDASSDSGASGDASDSSDSGLDTSLALNEPEPAPKCCQDLDVLFVLDQSLSMEYQCFEETFGWAMYDISKEFHANLTKNVGSFHIGFTTASVVPENPVECRGMGSLMRGKPVKNCMAAETAGVPYLSAAQLNDVQFLNAAWCLLSAGTISPADGVLSDGLDPQNDPRPLEAMLAAIDPALSAVGACNEGFARPGVPLITFMFTNRDQPALVDEVAQQWTWWQTFRSLRGLDLATVRERNAFAMIVGPDGPSADVECNTRIPTQLLNFSQYYDDHDHDFVHRMDICALRSPTAGQGGCGPHPIRTEIQEFMRGVFSEDMLCDLCRP